ncbi:MAG: hypothetical protein QOJ02_1940 [Acidobacteriota bacterium]|nr:hypothetical protein [Acidobacteriota bacterium]
MNFAPLVSIIIPTYNYGRYICEAIDSVLSSTFPQSQIEIIVVDDGSTDNTSEKIEVYKDRIQYIFQENSGKAWATKVGIEFASGKYIFNLDADDLFLANKIQEVVNVFEKDKTIAHVAHPAICWNPNKQVRVIEPIPLRLKGRKILGKELLSYFYKRRILFGGGSTFAGRAEVLKQLPFPKEVDMYTDEYLVLMTLNHGYSFFLEQPLSVWRIHGDNFSCSSTNVEDASKRSIKTQRNERSMEAVLYSVLNSNFEEEIKKLYLLKTTVSIMAAREEARQKSTADIVNLWLSIPGLVKLFGYESLGIIKDYSIFNRSLPTSILEFFKKARRVLRGQQ